jgi:hypothetical protein
MKTLSAIAVFLLIILLLLSCRKDKDPLFDGVNCSGNCYILSGRLIDSVSKTGIADGEIRFYFQDNTGTFSSKKIYLGRTATNADGGYRFSFDGSKTDNKLGYYYAEAFKGYMFADLVYPNRVNTFHLDSSSYNIPFEQNFPMFRPAYLKVRVIAANVTNFQFLTVSYSYGKTGIGLIFHGGRNIDTVITWKTAGDLNTFVKADAVGNGVQIERSDTVLVGMNSTQQIVLRF